MRWMDSLLQDAWALGGLLVIASLALATRVFISVQRRNGLLAVSAFFDDLAERCRSWRPGEEPSVDSDPLWAAVSREILFREPDGKLVARTDPRRAAEQEALSLLGRGRRGAFLQLIGENLTAIALVFTFALLGIVLVGPVVEALRNSGDGQSRELRDAVGKMGAKFFISAFGLLGAVFAQSATKQAQDALIVAVRAGAMNLLRQMEELASYQARSAAASAEAVIGLRADLRAVGSEWTQQLRRLESINVTINGIGEEVATRFSTVMTKDVADRICSAVVDLQNHAAGVADSMQKHLATSFASALQAEVGRVHSGLEEVRAAVHGQGQSDIEALLNRMSDMLTGGFRSESASMATQLGQFAAVLPQLQVQFTGLAESMRENTERYGEQNSRAIETLGARMSDLVVQFDAARVGMNGAVEQMAHAGSSAARELSTATGAQLGGLLEMFDATRARLDSMMDRLSQVSAEVAQSVSQSVNEHSEVASGQLRSMQKATADGVANLGHHSASLAEAMGKVQSRLTESTSQLSRTIDEMGKALGTLAGIQSVSVKALGEYQKSAQQVAETVKTLDKTILSQVGVIDRENKLLESHREAAAAIQPVLAGFLKAYEDGVKRQSQLLGDQWATLASKTQQVVSAASSDLSESVEDLGRVVGEFAKASRGVR